MRIGVNCFLLHARAGGVRQYFTALFNELLRTDRDNEYVFFHTAQNLPLLEELTSDRWREHAVPVKDQRQARGHVHSLDLYFCPFGSLWPRPLPLPCVVTLVDIQEHFFPRFFTGADLYNRELHYVGSTRLAQRVVTISRFSKQTIVTRHGIAEDKVAEAHLCADQRFFEPDRFGVRPDLDLPERFAFFPANHWPHKNHETLFRALALLRQERAMTIPLVVTGHGKVGPGPPLDERIAAHGLTGSVLRAGYLRTEEIIYLAGHAEMLVFPSLFEGFGIPLVEAMAAGCPVVCSNTTSLPEVGGDAALYFDPEDHADMAQALARLWSDKALRDELVRRGRARVGLFSPARMAWAHKQAFAEARAAYRTWKYPAHWVRHGLHVLRTGWKYRGQRGP